MGIGLEDLRAVIATVTTDSPKGSIDGATRTFTIYANDQCYRPTPWNDAIIAYKNGAPVRVRDIGRAVDGPERTQARRLGRRQERRHPRGPEAARRQCDRHRRPYQSVAAAIAGSHSAIGQDRHRHRPDHDDPCVGHDVQFTLVLTDRARRDGDLPVPAQLLGDDHSQRHGAAWRWSAPLRSCISLGFSLDNLSLMGLSIAVGFVVDDAIVMLENIQRHMEEGLSPREAAIKGAGEIGFTIISISLSLVAVFIPLAFDGRHRRPHLSRVCHRP